MKDWKKKFIELAKSITDVDEDADFQRHLIETGTESEENAKILTDFIVENDIDCRGCWRSDEDAPYQNYEKLHDKVWSIDLRK